MKIDILEYEKLEFIQNTLPELSIISYLPQLQYLYNNASNQTRNTAFYRQPQNVIAPLSRASIHNG